MKIMLLYSFAITMLLSCATNKEKTVEIPNGDVVENISIKYLLSIYPGTSFEQYKGFTFSDTTCSNMQYVVLTKFNYFDVLSQEDIEKEKDQEIRGFLAYVKDEKSSPENLIECITNLFGAKSEKQGRRWDIIKENKVIGCLTPNSRNDGYVWVLSRHKSTRDLYSK